MEYRALGNTGLRVSELCLGTMLWGSADVSTAPGEQTAHRMLDRFAEAGGMFFDTADVYARGRSEEILGSWLKHQDRDGYVIATKVCATSGPGPNDRGLSRKHLMASIEGSLRRLGTDYVDLYQIHTLDRDTPLEETLSTLNDLVRSGKVRYLGASNVSGWYLQKAIELCRHHGWEPYVCQQPRYNLLSRGAEAAGVIAVSLDEGLGVIPWSPLQGGWLSGKYRRGMSAPPEDTRIGRAGQPGNFFRYAKWDNFATEATWNVIDTLHDVAAETGKSSAQVALRWLLQRPAVTAPIVGAMTIAQLEDNLGAVGWQLAEEQVERLTKASDQVYDPTPAHD